jgi:osmotically-inducible protein OsmY
MKRRKLLVRYFGLMMLMAALVACAATSTRESTGEYIDDTVITTKVKTMLAGDNLLKSFKISVETFKGVVQLNGLVDSQYAVDRAGEIAVGVKGVASVKNNLKVKN